MKVYLILYDLVNKKRFKKYFETEFIRDKFARKLRYSKKLVVLNKGID